MSDIDSILSSLEVAAEKNIDISEPAYKYYFEASPESREMMSHMDNLMRGRILSEVINLMMMSDGSDKQEVVRFEVETHMANGVTPKMYDKILNAVYLAMRDSLDEEWTPEFERAWKSQIAGLIDAIETQIESQTVH